MKKFLPILLSITIVLSFSLTGFTFSFDKPVNNTINSNMPSLTPGPKLVPKSTIIPNFEGFYWQWSEENQGIEIIGYTGSGGNVIIPQVINSASVTSIDWNAFQSNKSIISVTFPTSITYIGKYAFESCSNMTAAYFYGDAPSISTESFSAAATGFKIFYSPTSVGFTNPWNGYSTEVFTSTPTPTATPTKTPSPTPTATPTPTPTPTLTPVLGVKLNKTTLTLKKGKTYKLIATISPSNASNKKVTWRTGSYRIATVSSKGIVKANRKGSVNIYVYTVDGKKTAKCKVVIK